MTRYSDLIEWLWPLAGTGVVLAVAFLAASHVILNRRDPRAAGFWVGIILLMPLAGALLYWLLGINRIRRSAREIRSQLVRYRETPDAGVGGPRGRPSLQLPPSCADLEPLANVVGHLTGRALLGGNRAGLLVNGEEAYPAMLAAIRSAERSVTLCSYIFDNDPLGRSFVEELAAAAARGVEVRVLIDDLGTRYSSPSVVGLLRSSGVKTAVFLPLLNLRRIHFLNLRNHRKLLVVDGRIGFTGGMNIRAGHLVESAAPREATQDVHARFEGPVVAHIQEMFAQDWHFVTGEALRGELWFPHLAAVGSVLARGIADGPDGDHDTMRLTLIAALAGARRRVAIQTPYFLPDRALLSALNVAAMRGAEVDILLPARSNLPYVQWATTALLWQVLGHGCRVWLTPPPFDHSKLMVVDDCWLLLGSTNWDPRALRLNFEFNVECYDPALAAGLLALIEAKRATARLLTMEDVDGRSLPIKLRDGVARLFTPFF